MTFSPTNRENIRLGRKRNDQLNRLQRLSTNDNLVRRVSITINRISPVRNRCPFDVAITVNILSLRERFKHRVIIDRTENRKPNVFCAQIVFERYIKIFRLSFNERGVSVPTGSITDVNWNGRE